MTTAYPTGLDALTNPSSSDTLASPSHSAQHANINDGMEAVQATLGTNPQGASASVSARIGVLEAVPRVLGSGDAQSMYNATTAQILGVKDGTAGTPDTSAHPLLKVERTVAVADGDLTGDASEQLASILGISVGTTALAAQPVGVGGFAKHSGTTAGSGGRVPDACGVYGVGRITGSGTGVGIGGFLLGRRDNDTARISAVEAHVANYGTVAGVWNSTGFSDLTGIWINVSGNADAAAGIAIGNAFGRQFKVGLGFNAQVSGGLTGGVADASIRDDSHSVTSLDIRGSHTYGLDFQLSTFSGAAIRLPNSATGTGGIYARNGANSASHSLLYYNASDNLVLGGNASAIYMSTGVTLADAKNLVIGTGTGTKIGTATGQKIGFWNVTPVVQPAAYTASNVTTDRSFDANSYTTDELADVLGTLIADLKSIGLVG